jgi:hypothetical protein
MEPERNEAGDAPNDEFTIDPGLIESFRAGYKISDSENGTAPADESAAVHFKQLNEIVNYGLNFAHDALQKNELPGLGNEKARKLKAELAVIVAERQIPAEAIKNSPEYFLGLLIFGDIVKNAIASRNLKDGKKGKNE